MSRENKTYTFMLHPKNFHIFQPLSTPGNDDSKLQNY